MSGYATAFGRAVNNVYEVHEGRPFLAFRSLMLVLAVFLVIGFAGVAALLLATPSATQAFGVTDPWLTVWAIARWPVLAVLVGVIIAVLYYATPNVKHDRFRWVSYGALFAILVWALATLAFYGYIALIGQYDRIYGWIPAESVVQLPMRDTRRNLMLARQRARDEADAALIREDSLD